LEVVTVGFPFCAFKVLAGVALLPGPWRVLGGALVALGAADLLLNAIAFTFAATGRDASLPVCTAQWVVTRFGAGRVGWRQLGLSVDAMFAFTLVAVMIGAGGLAHLPPAALGVWSVSVVFNVLGAGLGRLAESVLELGPRAR
jgi:hypothetical protein